MSNVVKINNVVFDFDEERLRSRFLEVCNEHTSLYSSTKNIFKDLLYLSFFFIPVTIGLFIEFGGILLGISIVMAVLLCVMFAFVYVYYKQKHYNVSVSSSMCIGIGDGFENTIKAIENLCSSCDGSMFELSDLYVFNCIWYIHELVKRNEEIFLDVKDPLIYAGKAKRELALDLSEPKDLDNTTLYITTDNIYVM